MRNKILAILGVLVAFGGLGGLLTLLGSGYKLGAFPDVFFIQIALAATASGAVLLWRYGQAVAGEWRLIYLKTSFPNQPWMWRLDWSRRQSTVAKSTQNLTAWAAATWNLAVTPVAIATMHRLSAANVAFFLLGGVVLIGAGLFVYACLRMWYRHNRNYPTLRLLTNPGKAGKPFSCQLTVPGVGEGVRWVSEIACTYVRTESVRDRRRFYSQQVVEDVWKQVFHPIVARSATSTSMLMRFETRTDLPLNGNYRKGEARWVVRISARNRLGKTVFQQEYQIPMFYRAGERIGTAVSPLEASKPSVNGLALVDEPPAKQPTMTQTARDSVTFHSKVDVDAMLLALKKSGVKITNAGVVYADQLWNQENLIRLYQRIIKFSCVTAAVMLAATGLSALFVSWMVGLPFLVLGCGAAAGALGAVYIRHLRYKVVFNRDGITRHSRFFSRRWEKTIPWEEVQSVVWRSFGNTASDTPLQQYRQLVINPDDKSTRLVLSPAIKNHDAVESLVQLIESITRRSANRRRTA